MSDEQQDIEETSPQPLSTSKPIPLYQPDEFQEYLTLDAPPLPPATAPSFLHASNAHPASSPMQAPARAIPYLRRKRADRKNMLVLLLALLLVGVTGGGFLFYALLLHPRLISTQKLVPSPLPSSPQALFKQVTGRKPALNDLFNNEDTSTWSSSSDQYAAGHCTFEADGYHVIDANDGTFYYCASQGSYLANFAFQAQETILTGDGASLIFRGSQPNSFYRFRVDQYGYYGLYLSNSPSTTAEPRPLAEGISQSIEPDLGQTNVLTVIAMGSDIYLYVNSRFVKHVRDNTLSVGQIGLSASDYSKSTDVVFQHAEVWNL